jgi:tight adherence protein C
VDWKAIARVLFDYLRSNRMVYALTQQIGEKLYYLYLQKEREARLQEVLLRLFAIVTLLFCCGIALTVYYKGGIEYIALSIAGPLLLPVLYARRLEQKINKQKEAILIELPNFINSLLILLHSGETVRRAFLIIAREKSQTIYEKHPFYKKLNEALLELNNNRTFEDVLEIFSKGCHISEVSAFAAVLMLNQKRGGEHIIYALSQLGRELWEKQKTIVRVLAEESAVKMVFPLMLLFIIILVITAAPAILQMEQIQ